MFEAIFSLICLFFLPCQMPLCGRPDYSGRFDGVNFCLSLLRFMLIYAYASQDCFLFPTLDFLTIIIAKN
ncbi:MAG: hypothetical protein A3K06_00080 [Candidatus Doudnabacteria bacterium RIFCSPHIGHO2_01_52_17]|uniref:Uncharacterized protein n=1 Tax=Candidatus Doudnabacteria bacterium RIFCSPHIGHO2_01_52_17 TaxID=1817820 RepID=A0A1F5NAN4_9BACT|nr:MAG: hypothetical protein A3K06_00080 [Candidatus Doudnabacteria bacterium RIFCSPHIGHO2_01_52_17]